MQLKTDPNWEKKIKEELLSMKHEANRIGRLLLKNEIPVDLIKVRDYRKYFRKEKLPKIEISHRTISTNSTKPYNTVRNPQEEKEKSFYGMTTQSFFRPKDKKNFTGAKAAIKDLSPTVYNKCEREFNLLPLSYKKLKRDFVWEGGQFVEEPQLIERYKKKDDHLSNDKEVAKVFPLNIFIPKTFRAQNYHFKKSLMLKKGTLKEKEKVEFKKTAGHLSIVNL